MAFDLFAFLDGASPWWWVALAVGLGAVEMLTFTYFMLWLSLAALAVAGILLVSPDMSGLSQVGAFAALSVLFTVAGWLSLRRFGAKGAAGHALNRRSEQVVGRTGAALDDFRNGEGVVVVDDVRWSARLASGEARKGAALRITGVDGMRLICEPPAS